MTPGGGSLDFFNEVARVGREILDVASPDVKRAYLDQVAGVYAVMRDIHDVVVDVTIRAGLAADTTQADRALSALDSATLAQTMRVRNWCDRLARLGTELRPLTHAAGIPPSDQAVWDELCTTLVDREMEVSRLYERSLPQLADLAKFAGSVEDVRRRLDELSTKLVTQKAEFDYLAKRAEAERDRLG